MSVFWVVFWVVLCIVKPPWRFACGVAAGTKFSAYYLDRNRSAALAIGTHSTWNY